MSRWDVFKHNCWQTLISFDQMLYNFGSTVWVGLALFLVKFPIEKCYADETLSSRCHRYRMKGILWPANIIDTLFWWDKQGNKKHCELSWESERNGRQLPPELR